MVGWRGQSLRAIPWTFAWTQTRVHLSAWLGCGEALNTPDPEKQKRLRGMYDNWPWFREVRGRLLRYRGYPCLTRSDNSPT